MKNIRFNVTPFSGKPEFVKINDKNIIVDRQPVTEEICFDTIVKLIDYLSKKGIYSLTDPVSGKKYTFYNE